MTKWVDDVKKDFAKKVALPGGLRAAANGSTATTAATTTTD